jgi:5,10-methylenetetrahydrofolate reductase
MSSLHVNSWLFSSIQGVSNLYDRLGRMAQTQPVFISCTWGAGGATAERTIALCATAHSVYGIETLMHLTCTNMGKDKVDEALKVSSMIL